MEGARFHSLTVGDVERLTDDAVAVTLEVPDDLAAAFAYRPGQHVTLRATIHGADVRRSYSICSDATEGRLRVGIKRLDGGTFSTWANEQLHPGATLQVMPPGGEFIIDPDPGTARHYAAIAAGSGITPVLSHVSTVLQVEPESRFTLVFGNRESRSVMFLEELEGLKDRYLERFQLIHVLSREEASVPLFSGRLDQGKLNALLDTVVDAASVDDWYLCGPYEMVDDARSVLLARGVPEARVHQELFFSEPSGAPPEEPEDTTGFSTVRFVLEARASTVLVDPGGLPILDHALTVRRELPFSCRGGMCTTCKARVVAGEVRMDKNWSLTQEELDAGYILTCQSHPVSDSVELTYDV
ncbi:MAG: phenylacetate-CoA oxygenase/reductase subunit PaaK [Actinobacteria bacterium]|nr:MAG: phenylacetate-CoA oxygenase/reductase subunit PaaK [Actinomycetota bacterium]